MASRSFSVSVVVVVAVSQYFVPLLRIGAPLIPTVAKPHGCCGTVASAEMRVAPGVPLQLSVQRLSVTLLAVQLRV